jgi:transcriptional regulator with XRE-family HTH domain
LLEQQVWADVEAFVRNPTEVLEQLQERLRGESGDAEDTLKQIARLEGLIAQKATERSRVVGLFRRGRVSEADLDAQLDEIGKEESALQSQLDEKRGEITSADGDHSAVEKASALLAEIGDSLDGPVSDEVKRRLIEVLVAGVRVDTIDSDEGRQARTSVTYRFAPRCLPVDLVAPAVRGSAWGSETGAPVTVGDHIRKRRLELRLLQREAAERIGVTACSVFNWENGVSTPDFRKLPAIIAFLGYNPVPEPTEEAERREWWRRSMGLSQKEAAGRLGGVGAR